MNNAECEFEYTNEFALTVNWAECVDVAIEAAQNTVGKDNVDGNVPAGMASEDFGTFLQKIPGCFVFISNGADHWLNTRYRLSAGKRTRRIWCR